MSVSSPALEWYAIRVKSIRERVTGVGLEEKGYEVFLPEYGRADKYDPGKEPGAFVPRIRVQPFRRPQPAARADPAGRNSLVSVGRIPAPVDATELESLRVLVQAGLPINPNETYTV